MKALLLSLFSLATLSAIAQNSPWSVGVSFSPKYSYRSLKSSGSEQRVADIRNDNETPRFGYSTGIGVLYKVNRRVSLEAGVQYSLKDYKSKESDFTTEDQFDPNTGLPIASGNVFSLRYKRQYLDIPVKFHYVFLDKQIKLYATVGFAGNFLLRADQIADLKQPDGTVQKTVRDESLNSTQFSIIGGVGLQYGFSERIGLRLEPQWRRMITPLRDTPIKEYLWSAGLNCAVYLRL